MKFGLNDLLRLILVTPDTTAFASGWHRPIEDAIKGGVSAIMYREKRLDDIEFSKQARAIREFCVERDVGFILNERDHLIDAIEPDVFHITHRTLRPDEVPGRFGEALTVGRSCHDVREVSSLDTNQVDYVIFGPVFDTPSKRGILAPRGIRGLGAAVEASPVPVVAIGGIDGMNAASVKSAGSIGVAVIRAGFDGGIADVSRAWNSEVRP